MSTKKNSRKTLLLSVIMSSPGPLISGLGLIVGNSATQIADFLRRTSELLAIIMSFAVFTLTSKNEEIDLEKKEKLEKATNIAVGVIMFICGAIMLVLAFFSEHDDMGNVVPSLVIAILSVTANTIFWKKYTALNKKDPNSILKVQSRLYRAKSIIDSCVIVVLLFVIFLPGSLFAYYIDLVGSAIVAGYLAYCGCKTVYERIKEN